MSNFSTMILELLIAAGAGLIIAFIFFLKERNDKEWDTLHQRIQDLKHSIQLVTLELQLRDSKITNETQKNMIERMEPIIQKQGEMLKKQEEKERIRIENIKGNLVFYLQSARNNLLEIRHLLEKEVSPIEFLGDHKNKITYLDTSVKGISSAINELFSLEVEIPREVSITQGEIGMYLNKLKEALNSKRGYLEYPPDPISVINKIDIVLKELPEPGPAWRNNPSKHKTPIHQNRIRPDGNYGEICKYQVFLKR